MARGNAGTVPMVKATLIYAAYSIPQWDHVALTDVSSINCYLQHVALADVYVSTRPHMQTWYQHQFQAEVAHDHSLALQENLKSLGYPVSEEVAHSVASYAQNKYSKLWGQWVDWCTGNNHNPELALVELLVADSCSVAMQRLSSLKKCSALWFVVKSLGKVTGFADGWKTMWGWTWIIPRSTVMAYNAINILIPGENSIIRWPTLLHGMNRFDAEEREWSLNDHTRYLGGATPLAKRRFVEGRKVSLRDVTRTRCALANPTQTHQGGMQRQSGTPLRPRGSHV